MKEYDQINLDMARRQPSLSQMQTILAQAAGPRRQLAGKSLAGLVAFMNYYRAEAQVSRFASSFGVLSGRWLEASFAEISSFDVAD